MIALASDHGGYKLKQDIIQHFEQNEIVYHDYGCYADEACDYADFAGPACEQVVLGNADCAVLVCGTGIGMSMAANKVKGIRAAVCTDEYCARMTRRHNDANVLCLGERVVGTGLALEIVDVFLKTAFEGGRHQTRIDKIAALKDK